jgi:CRISPR-associated endonuclease Csn1
MSQDILDKFGQGQSHSQTAERTGYRSVRRLRQRHLLRRERLHRVLNILNALPVHYSNSIDFDIRKGQFKDDVEVKLNYKENEEKKSEFLFKESFEKMTLDFKKSCPDLFYTKTNRKETKIPYDWTIYFLRKRALEKKISLQELAWILLSFNQKRGYYQLRGEDEEIDNTKLIEFHALEVVDVTAEEANYKNEIWYNIKLENGWIYKRKSNKPIFDWKGKRKEFIVTTQVNEDGTVKVDKEGIEKRSFKAVDSEIDWIAIKKSTEEKIQNTKLHVGEYIYNSLLKNPKQKINGKLIRTIERHFYKDELIAILEKQKEFHDELNDKNIFKQCILELYSNNYAKQNILKQKDFTHLLVNDIVFYQRPLKSKKSLIDGCEFEKRTYIKDGVKITEPIKVIHKSHPIYQEFRLWQFISNLKIYKREKLVNGKLESDVDVTTEFLPDEDAIVRLFDIFNNKARIKQSQFLALKEVFGKKLSEKEFRWNYVEDKEYPLNETRALFISKLSKDKSFDYESFLTRENEIKLWHLLYSISDKKEFERALESSRFKLEIPIELRREFKKVKPFANDYGAFSEKAIKKLLPLMRKGKYWIYEEIDENVKNRIQKLITGEFDEKVKDKVREKAIHLSLADESSFKGLPLWLASYIVYDRHSESGDAIKWQGPNEISVFLKEFKQHSLRNPIVEQVITETLRVVKDIWEYYGNGIENYFDEIHIELGREMKNSADKRKRLTANINKNQDTNERIRNLLREFKTANMEGVIPHSPSQQEKLKIFEEDILNQYSDKELEKEVLDGVNIAKVSKSAEPTTKEIRKYKLWMEQKYRSPYTGHIIPLSKLFTTDYEIEHIIPQARYFDDSIGNKVICEAEVNKVKGNQTAFEFISKNPGRIIDLGKGESVSVFNVGAYQDFVSQYFTKGTKKFKILLSEDVPEQFISRQLNDTRYISKVVKALLSNIVRESDEQEATSKNIVSITGGVTTQLKNDWGLNDKWNELIRPRFERMNRLTNSNDFGYFDEKANFYRITVPIELKKNFNKKRIDHRHHAMDALVVALATRNHVSYLNNEHAKSDNKRYDLRNKLRRVEKIDKKGKETIVSKEFLMPWKSFPIDAYKALEGVVVSFKQNLRVINKASNKYQVRKDDKTEIKTQKGTNWAIRKPMHKETVFGKVNLQKIKVVNLSFAIDGDYVLVNKPLGKKIIELTKKGFDKKQIKKHFKERNNEFKNQNIAKVEVFYHDDNFSATRKKVDENFKSKKWIEESVTDTGIQKILINHLKKYNEIKDDGIIKERPDLAFSPEGLDDMNKNIKELNDGKNHQPIIKARVYETLGNKFPVSENKNSAKSKKYVEAAKGTNLFFAIYEGQDDKGKTIRAYNTIPLNIVIERQKLGYTSVPEKITVKGKYELNLLTYLSPNDLVYVPIDEELENLSSIDFSNLSAEQKQRIFKMVSSSKTQSFFVRNDISITIQNKKEFGALNKEERDFEGNMIKDRCIKLIVDRLGNVNKA